MSNDYVKELEKEVDRLNKLLAHQELAFDILSSNVTIKNTNMYKEIMPLWIAEYVEKIGWSLKHEAQHERYLVRSYISPKKDCLIKLYMKDTRPDASRRSKLTYITRNAIEKICSVTKKGQLQIIFEIMKDHA